MERLLGHLVERSRSLIVTPFRYVCRASSKVPLKLRSGCRARQQPAISDALILSGRYISLRCGMRVGNETSARWLQALLVEILSYQAQDSGQLRLKRLAVAHSVPSTLSSTIDEVLKLHGSAQESARGSVTRSDCRRHLILKVHFKCKANTIGAR